MKPVEILDDGASEWRLGPNLPLDVHAAPLVQDPSGGVLFIGGSATGTYEITKQVKYNLTE